MNGLLTPNSEAVSALQAPRQVCCHDAASPCPCPPHPALLETLTVARATFATSNDAQAPLAALRPMTLETAAILGMNDGVIFPPPAGDQPDAAPNASVNQALDRSPLRGDIKVAVVLVEFPDQRMSPGANKRFNDLFFSNGVIPTGSVTEYFSQVSGGKISMSGQVVGPYLMPQTLVNYAHGGSGYFDPKTGRAPVEPNTRTMGMDALKLAKDHINLDPYDNDRNGFVDAFVVVHAGSGAEVDGDLNKIWSVKWVLPESVTVNHVNVYAFLTIPEDARLGVCCHELGHLVFGWPDLYDIDKSSQGIGNWCLMAGGSWGGVFAGDTPCHPSAWCKLNQQWITLNVPAKSQHLRLPDVKDATSGYPIYKLPMANAPAAEYFLLEKRQRNGFDVSLPAAGLLIWHIDENQLNNADENHYKVALMQADNLNQLAGRSAGRGDDGDPYPGRSHNTSFTFASKPNSRSYAGLDTAVSITNISAEGANISMDISSAEQN